MKSLLAITLCSCLFLQSCQPGQDKKTSNKLAGDPNNAGLVLPEGFSAVIVADEIGRARHLVVNDNGDIYVRLRSANNGGGIAALRDEDGDGKSDQISYFENTAGTGIGIRNGYLYFSSDSTVHRYKLGSNLVPDGEKETIVEGFEYRRQHATKSFTFDDAGNIYVNVGAPSNACQEQDRTKGSPGMNPCPLLERFAGIWRFSADALNQKQMEHGHRFATGLRNCVAIRWNSITGNLYALQHGRDQLSFFYPELFNDEQSAELPSEEFFLIRDGGDYGWPYCYYDHLANQKVLAPEFGGDGKTVGKCAETEMPVLAFPGHYAPNDVLFYQGAQFPEKYKGGAFIAFHGSWNRAPMEQQGYHVVFAPFDGDKPKGSWEVFADNFANVKTIISPGDAFHRPTGLTVGPDGSLYVADSQGGTIYRIFYSGGAGNRAGI